MQHVLDEQAALAGTQGPQSAAAGELAGRIARELGLQHSVAAAMCVLQWSRDRCGSRHVHVAVYDACISACAVNYAPDEALKVFKLMDEDGKVASLRSLNMLLSACCNGGFVDVALEVQLSRSLATCSSPMNNAGKQKKQSWSQCLAGFLRVFRHCAKRVITSCESIKLSGVCCRSLK